MNPPGQVAYPYPNDSMIWDQKFMPSAEWYGIVTYRNERGFKPEYQGQKQVVTLVPCDVETMAQIKAVKRLNQWFLIKFMRGKPTLNKRKVYVLTAPTKLLSNYKDDPT